MIKHPYVTCNQMWAPSPSSPSVVRYNCIRGVIYLNTMYRADIVPAVSTRRWLVRLDPTTFGLKNFTIHWLGHSYLSNQYKSLTSTNKQLAFVVNLHNIDYYKSEITCTFRQVHYNSKLTSLGNLNFLPVLLMCVESYNMIYTSTVNNDCRKQILTQFIARLNYWSTSQVKYVEIFIEFSYLFRRTEVHLWSANLWSVC